MGTDFLNARQLPGQSPSETSGWQDGNFSKVMAIAAHPGDVFFAMGAPVPSLLISRSRLLSKSLVGRERLSHNFPRNNTDHLNGKQRRKLRSCSVQKRYFLQYPDGEVPINDEAKFAVCDLIRQYKPLTIVTTGKGVGIRIIEPVMTSLKTQYFTRASWPRSGRTIP